MGTNIRKGFTAASFSIAVAIAIGPARADLTIPLNTYYAAVAAGYWVIQGSVPGAGGQWVYCTDIGPATGWFGGTGPMDPQTQMVVPSGAGGWGWDNGSGYPCAIVQRTVQQASPQPPPSAPTGSGGGGTLPGPDAINSDDLRRRQ